MSKASTTIYVPAQPKVVMFCQIRYYCNPDATIEEPSYMMLILTALKRLNFRVHTLTASSDYVLVYLCEHMGEGADYDLVQNALKAICQSTLKALGPRSFQSINHNYSIKWVCG